MNDSYVVSFERSPEYRELMEAGKRIADVYALHRMADPYGVIGHFFAIRLKDGQPEDGNPLYPSIGVAREHVRRHDDENRWMYIQVIPGTLHARDAAILLKTHRRMYDAGLRISSMNGRQLIPRLSREDQLASVRSIFKGTPPANISFKRR